MANIYFDYLPPTGNEAFDIKAQQLVDMLRTYISEHDTSLATIEAAITYTDISSFTNSWVNFGGGYQNAAYTKTAGGWVSVVGLIKDGTVGSAAFTLPTGYRPAARRTFAVVTASEAHGCVYVDSSGNVVPVSPTVNTYVWLDGITFYAG